VTLRTTVNDALRRTTGYQLTRAKAAPTKPAATAKAPTPAAPAAAPAFPADYDDVAQRIITEVRPWTMTSREKLFGLVSAVRYVESHGIPGDVVECGVWRGGSMQAAAKTLLELGSTSRHLYLFDTFEGMPPPTEEDLRQDGKAAADLLAALPKTAGIWAHASLEDVQDGFAAVPYPAERVHFVAGMVEDTVPAQAPEAIAVLRLDTDWYASTRHELEQLYPRLSPGGVLIIDDYGWWQGSRKAVDEYVEQTGARLLLLRIDEGRIAVKP
jgi:hypothetical protein